jgi:hypothetical protein
MGPHKVNQQCEENRTHKWRKGQRVGFLYSLTKHRAVTFLPCSITCTDMPAQETDAMESQVDFVDPWNTMLPASLIDTEIFSCWGWQYISFTKRGWHSKFYALCAAHPNLYSDNWMWNFQSNTDISRGNFSCICSAVTPPTGITHPVCVLKLHTRP